MQRSVVSARASLDASSISLTKETDLLDELFKALLEELMTGRLPAVGLLER
ncbi:MAG: hypothetical protein ACOX6M_13225 [Armatimonadota bacterium]